ILHHSFSTNHSIIRTYLHSFPTRRSSDLFVITTPPNEIPLASRGTSIQRRTSIPYLDSFSRSSSTNGPKSSTHSREAVQIWDRGDRKSTRLNSSHLGISYAVFCLKKKKI